MLQNPWRWEHCTKKVTQALGIAQWEHHKSRLKICKHKETRYHPKIFMESFNHKLLNKWCGSSITPKIWKLKSKVRKSGKSDREWSNPYGNQATHFTGCTNAKKISCNCKNVRTTYDARLNICVSSNKEKKTQVRLVVDVGQKMRRRAKANNAHPNGSPYHVPNFDKMTMRSPCWED
jgi:hypothetical protein